MTDMASKLRPRRASSIRYIFCKIAVSNFALLTISMPSSFATRTLTSTSPFCSVAPPPCRGTLRKPDAYVASEELGAVISMIKTPKPPRTPVVYPQSEIVASPWCFIEPGLNIGDPPTIPRISESGTTLQARCGEAFARATIATVKRAETKIPRNREEVFIRITFLIYS